MIDNQKNLISDSKLKILNHLNKTCSYGQVFVLTSSEDIRINHYLQLSQLLQEANKSYKKLCEKQLKQSEGQTIPEAFKLKMSFDTVTKQPLTIPFKAMSKDKLILDPLFCDFSVIIEKISKSENALDEIKQINADEQFIILQFWNIRQLLIREHQNDATFEIILYPKKCNFGICKIENNIEAIYFHSIDHKLQFLIQNSLFHNTISKAIQQNKLKEFSVCMLEKNDETLQKLYNNKIQNEIIFQKKIDLLMRKDINQDGEEYNNPDGIQYEKLVILDENTKNPKYTFEDLYLFKDFHITNPINYQSTLCLNDDYWQDNLKHFIKLESNDNPKCECGRQFDPYTCDTFIIDSKLREVFKQIIYNFLLSKENLVYTTIFPSPIFVEIETRKYDNKFFVLYCMKQDKNNIIKKVKFTEMFFQGKILNYDLDQIQDRENRSLFEEDNGDYDSDYVYYYDNKPAGSQLCTKEFEIARDMQIKKK